MRRATAVICLIAVACASSSVVELAPKPGDGFDVAVKGNLATRCGLLPSRYYDADSQLMTRIAACLRTHRMAAEHVTISGSTDTRARRLAAYLQRRGISPQRINVIERGTMSTGMAETKLDKENDRRVELELTDD